MIELEYAATGGVVRAGLCRVVFRVPGASDLASGTIAAQDDNFQDLFLELLHCGHFILLEPNYSWILIAEDYKHRRSQRGVGPHVDEVEVELLIRLERHAVRHGDTNCLLRLTRSKGQNAFYVGEILIFLGPTGPRLVLHRGFHGVIPLSLHSHGSSSLAVNNANLVVGEAKTCMLQRWRRFLRWRNVVTSTCDLARRSLILHVQGRYLPHVASCRVFDPGCLLPLFCLDELDQLVIGKMVPMHLEQVALDLRQVFSAQLGADDPGTVLLSLLVLLVVCTAAAEITTVCHVGDSDEHPEENKGENAFPYLDHIWACD
mmetsp:Transcript_26969/g.62721  ORF Transcript_26969/g.62721 Transcript_26969/m.62721 type:complete len:317 (-) Transcript_26969:586-1536(-)